MLSLSKNERGVWSLVKWLAISALEHDHETFFAITIEVNAFAERHI